MLWMVFVYWTTQWYVSEYKIEGNFVTPKKYIALTAGWACTLWSLCISQYVLQFILGYEHGDILTRCLLWCVDLCAVFCFQWYSKMPLQQYSYSHWQVLWSRSYCNLVFQSLFQFCVTCKTVTLFFDLKSVEFAPLNVLQILSVLKVHRYQHIETFQGSLKFTTDFHWERRWLKNMTVRQML